MRHSLRAVAALSFLALAVSCGESAQRYAEDDDPNALTFESSAPGLSSNDSSSSSGNPGAPGSGSPAGAGDSTLSGQEESTVEVGEPYDIVVGTSNPDADRVTFEVDGNAVGTCDSRDPAQDCKTENVWQWTVSFDAVGRHIVGATFVDARGVTVRATTAVNVVAMTSGGQVEEGRNEGDPVADDDLVLEGTSQVVQAIDSGRGFLDPSKPAHAVCSGTSWAITGQRVVLSRGRIDGSTSEVARCVSRYGAWVRRYADLNYVSRAAVYGALVARGDCNEDGVWTRPLVSATQCAALNRGMTAAACAARMASAPDFAIDTYTRYIGTRTMRLRHRFDPPRLAAMLSTGGAIRCSRANHWHMLSTANFIDRFVAAYNAYRTSETGSDISPPVNTSVTAVDFAIDHNATLASSFVGVGAQFNGNITVPFSRTLHPRMTDTVLGDLPRTLTELAPRHVRIFFDSRSIGDADRTNSFIQSVRLAQDAGASVNVTYWHGPYNDPNTQMGQFADALANLRVLGITAVQYVTVQNEVNSTRITPPQYEAIYRALDAALRARGIRDTIHFVGGDLLRDGQTEWLTYMGEHMSDLLDGYSVHIYWNNTAPGYMVTRLTEVRRIVDAMPAAQRRPLYVMEYGTRGDQVAMADLPDSDRVMLAGCTIPRGIPFGAINPGRIGNDLVSNTARAAWQHAWFDVLATSLGYVGLSKWDAFPASYDCGPQDYALMGLNAAGWDRRPAFYASELVSRFAQPGWRILRTNGGSENTYLATTFRSPTGDWSILAMNVTNTPRFFRVRGLPSATPFQVAGWAEAAPRSIGRNQIRTDVAGNAVFRVPAHGVVGLTTVDPGL